MIERDPATGLPIFRPDGKVLRAFMRDKASRVKIIQGPVGSGTSSACCLHIFQQANEQPVQADGRQRFRAHVFRETYPKIEETALRTWLDWVALQSAERLVGEDPIQRSEDWFERLDRCWMKSNVGDRPGSSSAAGRSAAIVLLCPLAQPRHRNLSRERVTSNILQAPVRAGRA